MDEKIISDWELLSLIRKTDDAFAILFKRHKDYVCRLAYGFSGDAALADEITQEVFIRVYEGKKRWFIRAKFTTWLYRTTLNTSRELMRTRKRETELLASARNHQHLESKVTLPERKEYPALKDILLHLPERQREALVLRFYEKLSIKETAAIMGCREGTVKSHLHKALQNMRRLIDKSEVENGQAV